MKAVDRNKNLQAAKTIADTEFYDVAIRSEIIFSYSGRARKGKQGRQAK